MSSIKEKDLESLILNLLDKSLPIQNKICSICGVSQDISYSSDNSETEYLKSQVNQYRNDYQQADENAKEYKRRFEQMQKKCRELERESDNYRKRTDSLERENTALKERNRSLSASLKEAADNLQSMKERFSKPVILLKRYKALSSSIRTGLSDVICDKDEILFVASCSAPEHLKAIWTYTKKLAGNSGNSDEIETLKDIFDYFFEIFNSSLREPMYVRDSVETGAVFDDDKYDRCTGSSTSGKITQIILRGYKSVNTGNIICRSLVRI